MIRRASTVVLFLCLISGPLLAEGDGRSGFYLSPSVGWSVGSGYAFDWHIRPYSDKFGLGYWLGGGCLYAFGDRYSVGVNVLYQKGTYDWEITSQFLQPGEGSEPFHFWTTALTGTVDIVRFGAAAAFLEAGGGLCWTDWPETGAFDGTYFDLLGGLGIRLRLSNRPRPPELALSASFHHLIDPEEYDTATASFFRFGASLEIGL